MTATKYAYLGGFEASSNVQAGFMFGIPIAGTLAHSMIMSYETVDDCKFSRYVTPLNGGEKVDLLEMALNYREKLNWHGT